MDILLSRIPPTHDLPVRMRPHHLGGALIHRVHSEFELLQGYVLVSDTRLDSSLSVLPGLAETRQ